MLTSVTIKNFKSYDSATLDLAPISLLIGMNASGKSNALEGLALAAWAARSPRLADLRWAVREGSLRLRGSSGELVRAHADSFQVVASVQGPDDIGRLDLTLALAERHNGLAVLFERLDAPDNDSKLPLYEATPDSSTVGLSVSYNNFARGGKKPHVACSDDLPVFAQFTTPARFAKGHDKAADLIPRAAQAVREALAGIHFLDPAPHAMREWVQTPAGELSADGSNLSGVLYDLLHGSQNAVPNIRTELLSFVEGLPQNHIGRVDFLMSPRHEVMVQLLETFGGAERLVPAALLSDGTLRVLAIAAAMLSTPPGRLVVIEEVDNGIHPSRAHRVLETIARVAKRRSLRVLITSHNPAMLDALPTSALADVMVCSREAATGESRLTRLGSTPDFVRMTARGGLGGQMTRGEVEDSVRRAAVATRAEVAEWLADLGVPL